LLLSNSIVDLELLANSKGSNPGAGYLPDRYAFSGNYHSIQIVFLIMKKFKTGELSNSLLYEIFRRNLPDYKIYYRTEEDVEKVIVEKNKSVAIAAFVTDFEEEDFLKSVKFEYSASNSKFHNYVLPWILFLFAAFPLVIWFIVYLYGRSKLHEESKFLLVDSFDDVLEDSGGNLYFK